MCRKEISYLKMSQKEREQLHAEFQILSGLRHPNIVAYYHREHLKLSQDLHFYMEYCGNGDLGRVIKDLQQKNQYAEESFVWSIFSQLIMALYRCHYGVDPPEVGKSVLGLGATAKPKAPQGGMTILHRDLKPENGKFAPFKYSRLLFGRILTPYSVPQRGQLGQAWRLWPLEDHVGTRFRIDLRRNAILHVS